MFDVVWLVWLVSPVLFHHAAKARCCGSAPDPHSLQPNGCRCVSSCSQVEHGKSLLPKSPPNSNRERECSNMQSNNQQHLSAKLFSQRMRQLWRLIGNPHWFECLQRRLIYFWISNLMWKSTASLFRIPQGLMLSTFKQSNATMSQSERTKWHVCQMLVSNLEESLSVFMCLLNLLTFVSLSCVVRQMHLCDLGMHKVWQNGIAFECPNAHPFAVRFTSPHHWIALYACIPK